MNSFTYSATLTSFNNNQNIILRRPLKNPSWAFLANSWYFNLLMVFTTASKTSLKEKHGLQYNMVGYVA